jgi:hypothetical protein
MHGLGQAFALVKVGVRKSMFFYRIRMGKELRGFL